MSKLSGCIVTYNNADKICNALNSIFAVNSEINMYVVDNCSTDDTADIVKKKFPQVTVIKTKKNKGFGAGHNQCIDQLDSELHFIINPDIVVNTDVFTSFEEYFKWNPEVVMSVPKFLDKDGKEQFTPKLQPKLKYMIGGRFEKFGNPFKHWRDVYTMRRHKITEPVEVGFCSGCFICIRTDIFKKLGGFDDRYFLYNEDADLTREASKLGKTTFIPSIEVIHLWERAYMKSFKYFVIQISSMFKYFWKWRKDK